MAKMPAWLRGVSKEELDEIDARFERFLAQVQAQEAMEDLPPLTRKPHNWHVN